MVCATCVAPFVSGEGVSSRLFRVGIDLFAAMNWISGIGYAMFPLADGGRVIASFQEGMRVAVTAAVVLLSIASLAVLILAGFREPGVRGTGIWAAIALGMMWVGAIGQTVVSPEYFGVVERFSVFAAVGFNAVLGLVLLGASQRRDLPENAKITANCRENAGNSLTNVLTRIIMLRRCD